MLSFDQISKFLYSRPKDKIFVFAGSLHTQLKLNFNGKVLSQIEMLYQKTNIQALSLTIKEQGGRSPVSEIYSLISSSASPVFLPTEDLKSYTDGFILIPALNGASTYK